MKTLANPCRRRLAALCLAMCTLPAAFAAQAQTAAPPALELRPDDIVLEVAVEARFVAE